MISGNVKLVDIIIFFFLRSFLLIRLNNSVATKSFNCSEPKSSIIRRSQSINNFSREELSLNFASFKHLINSSEVLYTTKKP